MMSPKDKGIAIHYRIIDILSEGNKNTHVHLVIFFGSIKQPSKFILLCTKIKKVLLFVKKGNTSIRKGKVKAKVKQIRAKKSKFENFNSNNVLFQRSCNIPLEQTKHSRKTVP